MIKQVEAKGALFAESFFLMTKLQPSQMAALESRTDAHCHERYVKVCRKEGLLLAFS